MATRKLFLFLCASSAAVIVATTFAGDPPTPPRDEASKQLASVLKQRRDILQQIVKVLTSQYKSGTVSFEVLVLASDRVFDAEIELATTRADRIAAYEKKVGNLLEGEKFLERRFKAGYRVTEIALLEAKAARLKAEVQLLREKAGDG